MFNSLSDNGERGNNKMGMNIFLLIVNCIINVCNICIIKCYISIIILLVFNINIYVDYKSILNI